MVIDGRPHAVSGGYDGRVRVWDLADGAERAVLTGHSGGVEAVACMVIDGRPHAVSGGNDRTLGIWDLGRGRLVETMALPLPTGAVAVYGHDIVIGIGHEVVVLTARGPTVSK
ncbi:WD40 repeat domain-containing protein [Streptomyces sp. NPDC003710]